MDATSASAASFLAANVDSFPALDDVFVEAPQLHRTSLGIGVAMVPRH
jgi:hypothetical protein